MWANTAGRPRGSSTCPASRAVLSSPGMALPRYQKACCQTGSSAGPIGASITSSVDMPTPMTGTSTLSDGIRSSNGTATGPARMASPGSVRAAGTGRAAGG